MPDPVGRSVYRRDTDRVAAGHVIGPGHVGIRSTHLGIQPIHVSFHMLSQPLQDLTGPQGRGIVSSCVISHLAQQRDPVVRGSRGQCVYCLFERCVVQRGAL